MGSCLWKRTAAAGANSALLGIVPSTSEILLGTKEQTLSCAVVAMEGKYIRRVAASSRRWRPEGTDQSPIFETVPSTDIDSKLREMRAALKTGCRKQAPRSVFWRASLIAWSRGLRSRVVN